jgi:hypothetical protein
LEVGVTVNIAAEVHVALTPDFTPGADTFQGVLYGPDMFHVIGTPPGVDLYTQLVAPGGGDTSALVGPVQTVAIL